MDKKGVSADFYLKRLIFKILIFDVIILAALLWVALSFTATSKERIADQISDSFRSSLLTGDNRRIALDMTGPVLKDFLGVRWKSSNTSYSFTFPDEANLKNSFFLHSAVVPVYFDEERTALSGELSFYYYPYAALPWIFLVWIFLAGISAVVGYFEMNRFKREYSLIMELRLKESMTTLAAQVAHDIRSPLAALGAAAKGLEMPEDQRKLVEGAVGRMQGIADDLLQRYRAPSAGQAAAKTAVIALGGLIEQVLSEKRLQHKDKTGLKIEFNVAPGEIKALVEPKELQRLLSNLVNNSVEAFAGPGTVAVSLSALDGKVFIEVKDNGKGIPPEILTKLGQKGETHGKAGGNGLGLYHARTTVEGWGGNFKIESEQGKGTSVSIALPRAGTPAGKMAILLDDDMLVHMNWKLAAKAAGVELKAYKTPEELSAGAKNLHKDTPVYIDSDLGNNIKGEDIAIELRDKGFTCITMATGHGADKFAHLPWLKVTGKEPPWA